MIMGKSAGIVAALLVATVAVIGLSMLVLKVTVANVCIALLILYFAIQLLSYPLTCNDEINKTRVLAWDCLGELMMHGLLFKGNSGDDAVYKGVVNNAKHLLNIVQTNDEGIKLGTKKFSNDMVMKLLSICFSATVVILRTGDLSEFGFGAGGGGAGGGNSTVT